MTVSAMAYMNSSYRNMLVHQAQSTQSLKRLSSGYRINSAADDAAGLAISERMRGQIGGLSMASQNAQNAVSLVQTAEGGLSSSAEALTRMKELAAQASNGTYSADERAALNQEFTALKSELDRISSSINYNGTKLLDGTLGGKTGAAGLNDLGISGITTAAGNTVSGEAKFSVSRENGGFSITARIGGETVTNRLAAGDASTTFTLSSGDTIQMDFSGTASALKEGVISGVMVNAGNTDAYVGNAVSNRASGQAVFQVGANNSADQRFGVSVGDMSSWALGLGNIDISTVEGANAALDAISSATNIVSGQRAVLGATQNRLDHTLNNLGVTTENLTKSESVIRDVDMALELMRYTQSTLMAQASQSMLAQGMNLSRQNMLSLLMG